MRSSYETASTFMEEEPQVINYKTFKILSMDEETKQREAEIKREVSRGHMGNDPSIQVIGSLIIYSQTNTVQDF